MINKKVSLVHGSALVKLGIMIHIGIGLLKARTHIPWEQCLSTRLMIVDPVGNEDDKVFLAQAFEMVK